MDQLQLMQVFLRVAELSSFSQAASSLALPKARASEAVQQLEAQLGVRLLHRTTRRVQMTQDGLVYFERCKDLLADVDELQGMFQRSETQLRGRLRVDMSSGIAQNIVLPQLPQFLQEHPALDVELSSTDRRVDLVAEGFDCVLRVGELNTSSLIARPLGHFKLINCASHAYLQKFGIPRQIQDLANHQLIHYSSAFGSKSLGFEYVVADQLCQYPMAGNLTVNSSDTYLAACLQGLGIIQVPNIAVQEHLRNERLVEILSDYRAPSMPVNLLYANRRHLPKRVQVFMQWVAELVQNYLQISEQTEDKPIQQENPA